MVSLPRLKDESLRDYFDRATDDLECSSPASLSLSLFVLPPNATKMEAVVDSNECKDWLEKRYSDIVVFVRDHEEMQNESIQSQQALLDKDNQHQWFPRHRRSGESVLEYKRNVAEHLDFRSWRINEISIGHNGNWDRFLIKVLDEDAKDTLLGLFSDCDVVVAKPVYAIET